VTADEGELNDAVGVGQQRWSHASRVVPKLAEFLQNIRAAGELNEREIDDLNVVVLRILKFSASPVAGRPAASLVEF
jgi:hypothetical protein